MLAEKLLLPLLVGIIMGLIFSLMKLPLPTPDKIEGVIGVAGVFIGMLLVKYFIK